MDVIAIRIHPTATTLLVAVKIKHVFNIFSFLCSLRWYTTRFASLKISGFYRHSFITASSRLSESSSFRDHFICPAHSTTHIKGKSRSIFKATYLRFQDFDAYIEFQSADEAVYAFVSVIKHDWQQDVSEICKILGYRSRLLKLS